MHISIILTEMFKADFDTRLLCAPKPQVLVKISHPNILSVFNVLYWCIIPSNFVINQTKHLLHRQCGTGWDNFAYTKHDLQLPFYDKSNIFPGLEYMRKLSKFRSSWFIPVTQIKTLHTPPVFFIFLFPFLASRSPSHYLHSVCVPVFVSSTNGKMCVC